MSTSKGLALVVLLLSLVMGYAASPPVPPNRAPPQPITNSIPNDSNRVILVTLKRPAAAAVAAFDLKPVGKRLKWHQFEVPPGQDKHAHIKRLKDSGLFEHVIEPRTYKTQATPNDPLYPQLWGLTNIQASVAWDTIRDATNVVVAVVDTGIDFSHPDLIGNLWTGPGGEHGFVATNGLVVPGGLDDHGHGTHVAGTIGAVGNNGVGVVGIAWKTKIMAMKVLHHGSGSSIDIVNGLEKLVDLKESGVPVLVSNHSYGGPGDDPFMRDGFEMLSQADIFAAVAAGNNSQDIDSVPFQPASFPFDNMVVATASDSFGRKAGFSNYGLTGTDIAAPGVSILSTTRSNTYSSFSGTSMAAPHVAGLAVLLRHKAPALGARQIRDVMLHPASYDYSTNFYQNNTSARINAAKALANLNVVTSNHVPVITGTSPYAVITDSKPVLFTATATDADNDPLRWVATQSASDFANYINGLTKKNGFLVQSSDNAAVVVGNPFAYQFANAIQLSVTDGRGGAASTNTGFEFSLDRSLRRPIVIKTWQAHTNTDRSVTLVFDVQDDVKTNYSCIVSYFNDQSGFQGRFNITPGTNEFTFAPSLGLRIVSIRMFVMDKFLNYANADQIFFNGLSTQCPITLSTNEGNVPLSVTFSKPDTCDIWVSDYLNGTFSQGSGDVTFIKPGLVLVAATTVQKALLPPDQRVIDMTLHPIFASRFLGTAPEPKPTIITMVLEGANTILGPWVTETNAPVEIIPSAPKRFYRTRMTIAR